MFLARFQEKKVRKKKKYNTIIRSSNNNKKVYEEERCRQLIEEKKNQGETYKSISAQIGISETTLRKFRSGLAVSQDTLTNKVVEVIVNVGFAKLQTFFLVQF